MPASPPHPPTPTPTARSAVTSPKVQLLLPAAPREGRGPGDLPVPRGLNSVKIHPRAQETPWGQVPTETQGNTSPFVLSLSPSEQNASVFNFSYFLVAAFNSCFIKSEQETAAPGMSLALNEERPSGSGPHKQTVREPLGPSGAPGP